MPAHVAVLADRYRSGELVLLDVLHTLQDRRGFLARPDLEALSYQARIPLATLEGTASFYANFRMQGPAPRALVRVCTSLPCHLNGADRLLAGLRGRLAADGGDVELQTCPCLGLCERAPAFSVNGVPMAPGTEPGILGLLDQGRKARGRWPAVPRVPFVSLARYRQEGGYGSLERVRKGELDFSSVIAVLKDSILRGSGGAGFPTGTKWELVMKESARPKYAVCNADEGEPGTFKDRVFLETTPHKVLEGLLIAANLIGAEEAVLYLREEYPAARANLRRAMDELRKAGLSSSEAPRLRLVIGAGAYICGEETALFESIEGKRGEPRLKPPYPTSFGLWGKPTLINNVETLAWIPEILRKGAAWFRDLGRHGAAGLKRYCLSGMVAKPGWYDAPLGTPANELVREYGGGMRDGQKPKAVFPGGVASGFLAEDILGTPMSFDTLVKAGSMLGSGGVIAVGQEVCAVDVAENCLAFFAHESCGKCTPCRVGTEKMLRMVHALRTEGTPVDPGLVDELGTTMVETSICGLGTTAPLALHHAMKYYPQEFEAHARGRCITGWCAQ